MSIYHYIKLVTRYKKSSFRALFRDITVNVKALSQANHC